MVCDQNERPACKHGHRDKGVRIERQFFEHKSIRCQRSCRRRQKRVSIRCRVRDQFGADIERGSGLVDDHHRLAPTLAEFFAHKTRQRVGKTAGWQRHNDGYRVAGEMRLCGSHRRVHAHKDCGDEASHLRQISTGHDPAS